MAAKRKAATRKTAAARPSRANRRGAQAAPAAEASSARERILHAALEVFAEQGFDGARTRDIAKRAGANLGLIPYYFGGKLPLWRAAVGHAFRELLAELGEIAAPASAPADERARLAQLLRRFVRFVAKRPEFMRLMNDEAKRDSPRMRWLADQYVKPLTAELRRHIERAQAGGVLPRVSAVSLHYIAVGAAGLVFSQAPECARVHGVDPTSEAFANAHADALVELLIGPGV